MEDKYPKMSDWCSEANFPFHQWWHRFVESLPQSFIFIYKQAELVGFLEGDEKKTFANLPVA